MKTVASSSHILFIESICNNQGIINCNVMQVKLSSPDYKGESDPENARLDFIQRIKHYESAYESLSEAEWSCSGKKYIPMFIK